MSKEEYGEILGGGFVLLEEVVVGGRSLGTNDGSGLHECETVICDEKNNTSEREVFKRVFDKEEKKAYFHLKNNVDSSGREEILEAEEMGARIGAKSIFLPRRGQKGGCLFHHRHNLADG